MPLVDPREQLRKAIQQLTDDRVRGAIAVLGLDDPPGERPGAVGVIPTGPAVERGAIGGCGRVGDEPLLRHIELAAQLPEAAATEISLLVLRRNINVDLFTAVLGALQLPR